MLRTQAYRQLEQDLRRIQADFDTELQKENDRQAQNLQLYTRYTEQEERALSEARELHLLLLDVHYQT